MPIKPGKSKKIISDNIHELTESGKTKGKIGNVPTPTAAKVRQVAIAIALDEARDSGAKIPRKNRASHPPTHHPRRKK